MADEPIPESDIVIAPPEHDILRWLEDAGVVGIRLAKRVIIDIRIDDVVRIYVDQFGSDKLLSVTPPDLSGAVVKHTVFEEVEVPDGSGSECPGDGRDPA